MTYTPTELLTVYLDVSERQKVGRLALKDRRILFEYDPTFAMPYFHGTDVALSGGANHPTRQYRAMRFIQRNVAFGTGTLSFRQILPPMPRLPVGPDLIYSGQSDGLIGDNVYDTDLYQ